MQTHGNTCDLHSPFVNQRDAGLFGPLGRERPAKDPKDPEGLGYLINRFLFSMQILPPMNYFFQRRAYLFKVQLVKSTRALIDANTCIEEDQQIS